jgi:hypothetical protein
VSVCVVCVCAPSRRVYVFVCVCLKCLGTSLHDPPGYDFHILFHQIINSWLKKA